MHEIATSAHPCVAGGTLHLYREPREDAPWQIRYFWRDVNPSTALAQGILFSQRLDAHQMPPGPFATPDDAVRAVRPLLEAPH